MNCEGGTKRGWWLLGLLLLAVGLPRLVAAEPTPRSEPPSAPRAPVTAADDRVRKAELLASERWRRAVFEFNAWLDAQPVYTPEQVRRIRGELADRVAAMSSFEVEYLMETLDAKLTVLDSPAARDARGWLGSYLAVMSDAKRAEVLRDVPDILDMTAAELEAAVQDVEARRDEVERAHDDAVAARRSFGRFRQATSEAESAERARLSAVRGDGHSFSPYRGPPVAPTPFADAYETPSAVGVGPWGSYLAFPVGAF